MPPFLSRYIITQSRTNRVIQNATALYILWTYHYPPHWILCEGVLIYKYIRISQNHISRAFIAHSLITTRWTYVKLIICKYTDFLSITSLVFIKRSGSRNKAAWVRNIVTETSAVLGGDTCYTAQRKAQDQDTLNAENFHGNYNQSFSLNQ